MNPTLVGFIKKELKQALRDVRMRAILFVLPVVQMLVFGLALTTEVRNIRLALSARPGDWIARRIEQRCYASTWFIPARTGGRDPFEWVRSGEAEAVVVAPWEGFTKALKRGQGKLQLIIDATNAVRARQVEAYLKTIIATVAGEAFKDRPAPAALSFDVRILYNPSMETSVFMVPGIMCMVLSIVTIILTGLSMAKEREQGTFETIIAAPVTNAEILFGKTLPYILIAFVDLPLLLGAGVLFFDVPMRGPLWMLLLAAFVYVVTTVNIGTVISTFTRNQQQAMMGGFLYIFPSILLSGFFFPVENMPDVFKVIAYVNPLMYFVTLVRNIMLKGGDLQVFLLNIGVMALIASAVFTFSVNRFRQTLN
jgi:ABC-2 type transport system permease protein